MRATGAAQGVREEQIGNTGAFGEEERKEGGVAERQDPLTDTRKVVLARVKELPSSKHHGQQAISGRAGAQ